MIKDNLASLRHTLLILREGIGRRRNSSNPDKSSNRIEKKGKERKIERGKNESSYASKRKRREKREIKRMEKLYLKRGKYVAIILF